MYEHEVFTQLANQPGSHAGHLHTERVQQPRMHVLRKQRHATTKNACFAEAKHAWLNLSFPLKAVNNTKNACFAEAKTRMAEFVIPAESGKQLGTDIMPRYGITS